DFNGFSSSIGSSIKALRSAPLLGSLNSPRSAKSNISRRPYATYTLRLRIEGGSLAAVLTVPRARARALAILVPGSGPTTRDGIPVGLAVTAAPPFELWSRELAGFKCASLRYDKRAAAYAERYRSGRLKCDGMEEEYHSDLKAAVKKVLRMERT